MRSTVPLQRTASTPADRPRSTGLCPCGCGAVVPTYPACSACACPQHPDCVGPDGRCVACWEAEFAPSERHLETTRLMGRALDAWVRRYGEHWAAANYPGRPWVRRRFAVMAREFGGEFSAAVEATGPRVLLRRVMRALRAPQATKRGAKPQGE
jgi:hypothetical protein